MKTFFLPQYRTHMAPQQVTDHICRRKLLVPTIILYFGTIILQNTAKAFRVSWVRYSVPVYCYRKQFTREDRENQESDYSRDRPFIQTSSKTSRSVSFCLYFQIVDRQRRQRWSPTLIAWRHYDLCRSIYRVQ